MNFIDRMKKTIAQGYENASKVLNDTAEKVKELGEKGILEYEVKKVEKEVENLMAVLGSEVYDLYRNNKLQTINETEEVRKILTEIESKENLITQKENELINLNNDRNQN